MLNELTYEYERHLKELQRDYEYEQERSLGINSEYDYIDISESMKR